MKIKKFTCIGCGAPKVNPYSTPYIMCDYCGMLTDLDFSLAMELWDQRTDINIEFSNFRADIDSKLANAFNSSDKAEYLQLKKKYWSKFYKIFNHYLPSTIDNDLKYDAFIDIYSRSQTNAAFDEKWQRYTAHQNGLMQKLVYEMKNGPKVEAKGFFEVAEFFIMATRESVGEFYSNPEFSFIFDIVPANIQLKLKLTEFVQAWLPYLTTEDADRLLEISGFSTQYVDIGKPSGKNGSCSNCRSEIYIPEGAFKVHCEACHKTTKVQATFKCMSCGADNNVPEYPAKPIDCEFCGVENRLIQRLFG